MGNWRIWPSALLLFPLSLGAVEEPAPAPCGADAQHAAELAQPLESSTPPGGVDLVAAALTMPKMTISEDLAFDAAAAIENALSLSVGGAVRVDMTAWNEFLKKNFFTFEKLNVADKKAIVDLVSDPLVFRAFVDRALGLEKDESARAFLVKLQQMHEEVYPTPPEGQPKPEASVADVAKKSSQEKMVDDIKAAHPNFSFHYSLARDIAALPTHIQAQVPAMIANLQDSMGHTGGGIQSGGRYVKLMAFKNAWELKWDDYRVFFTKLGDGRLGIARIIYRGSLASGSHNATNLYKQVVGNRIAYFGQH